MLGTRGCRLGLMYPEIYEMQVRAIVRAALAVRERTGEAPLVEIMHPLVGFARGAPPAARADRRRSRRRRASSSTCVGTMIELPRACIRADEIAEHADFFSFGTNDLTQTALGFSRDDAEGKFLTRYLEDGVLERNPFETLDEEGVGDLMRIAVERGRGVKEDLKLGICGEHGGEPRVGRVLPPLGLDYVSCSPYRVPLARLAAAQAALAEIGRAGSGRGRLGRRAAAAERRDALPVDRLALRLVAEVVDRAGLALVVGGHLGAPVRLDEVADLLDEGRVVDALEAPLGQRVRLARVGVVQRLVLLERAAAGDEENMSLPIMSVQPSPG